MKITSVRLIDGHSADDSATVWRIALATLDASRKQFAEWEAQCEEYRKASLKPHYCRHGRNMWVDHDIPCGECEEVGYYYFNYLHEAECALSYAKSLMAEAHRRRAAVIPLICHEWQGRMDSAPISGELWSWVSAPLKEWAE